MSATQTSFKSREIVEMISETKLGDFGVFMANAVKAGYAPVDVETGICSNFAATLILFVDCLPADQRERVCAQMCDSVRGWTLDYLQKLSLAGQGAPSPAAAE